MKLKLAAFWTLTLIVAFGLAAIATAHEWYDSDCCSGNDCAPIPTSAVSIGPEGYTVTIGPGDHPLAGGTITKFFRYDSPQVRVSQDGKYHTCVIGSEGGEQWMLCLYAPNLGS